MKAWLLLLFAGKGVAGEDVAIFYEVGAGQPKQLNGNS